MDQVINQFLAPYGFTNDQAGLAGGMLILAGLVGAAITGVSGLVWLAFGIFVHR